MNHIDPEKQLVDHIFSREHCVFSYDRLYLKDLRIFQGRNLCNMVIVDNLNYSFAMQIGNGVPIIPFYNNKRETELKNLLPYLEKLKWVEDVRPVIK